MHYSAVFLYVCGEGLAFVHSLLSQIPGLSVPGWASHDFNTNQSLMRSKATALTHTWWAVLTGILIISSSLTHTHTLSLSLRLSVSFSLSCFLSPPSIAFELREYECVFCLVVVQIYTVCWGFFPSLSHIQTKFWGLYTVLVLLTVYRDLMFRPFFAFLSFFFGRHLLGSTHFEPLCHPGSGSNVFITTVLLSPVKNNSFICFLN